MTTVDDALRRSLGAWTDRTDAVVAAVKGTELSTLEASLRGGDGPMRSARMMVERVSSELVESLLEALAIPRGPSVEVLLRQAAEHGLPLIGGWDADARVAKVYLNASDASESVRQRARGAFACPGPEAPHVIGVNAGANGAEEIKFYLQHRQLPSEASPALRRYAAGRKLAGAVSSLRVAPGAPVTKAWFVAVTPDDAEPTRGLPGWSDVAAAQLAPFSLGYVTQVGWAADDSSWTIYFKPAGVPERFGALDAELVFRCGDGELGIHLEPVARAPKAYARTARYAVSYRVRAGSPGGRVVDALMAWVVSSLAREESGGPAPDWSSPPPPWSRTSA